jgi:hypothetical protein
VEELGLIEKHVNNSIPARSTISQAAPELPLIRCPNLTSFRTTTPAITSAGRQLGLARVSGHKDFGTAWPMNSAFNGLIGTFTENFRIAVVTANYLNLSVRY